MNAGERARWAMNQRLTQEDREYAAEMLEDYVAEKSQEQAMLILEQWVFKIRVEGGLAVLSQIPAKLVG